jgi:hypothetical protein
LILRSRNGRDGAARQSPAQDAINAAIAKDDGQDMMNGHHREN